MFYFFDINLIVKLFIQPKQRNIFKRFGSLRIIIIVIIIKVMIYIFKIKPKITLMNACDRLILFICVI